jgi:hypothetical protein
MKFELEQFLKEIMANRNIRLDDGATATLANQLRQVESQLYKEVIPDLLATQFVPVVSGANPGAKSYGFRMASGLGMAKIIANYANDLPKVASMLEEHFVPIRGIGVAYGYSIQDLREAAMSGYQLESTEADLARLAVAQVVDDMLFEGSELYGVTGFINNGNVTIFDEVTGDWTNVATTDAEILADMNILINGVNNATRGKLKVTDVVMSDLRYQLLSQRYVALAAGQSVTLLQSMQGAHPGVTFSKWNRLATADAIGTGPRLVAYNKSPMVLAGIVPVEFEVFAPQAKGLGFEVGCHGRCGGTFYRYPVAAGYMDGC